jgi:undecaprenyl-diphosphatase
MIRATSRKSLLNALGFAGLLAVSVVLRRNPDVFDRAVAFSLNQLANQAGMANRLANAVTFPALQGVGVVALACAAWSSATQTESRERLIRGGVAAVIAAVIGLVLQESLPPLLKPIFDPGLNIRPADVLGDINSLRETSNPNAQSFPSERAVLFAGIAIATYACQRRIGLVALAGTLATELCRIYLGMHYPSDILGSVFLAATTYWLVEAAPSFRFSQGLSRWERASPATFYGVAFVACYNLATAFGDLREFLLLLLR